MSSPKRIRVTEFGGQCIGLIIRSDSRDQCPVSGNRPDVALLSIDGEIEIELSFSVPHFLADRLG